MKTKTCVLLLALASGVVPFAFACGGDSAAPAADAGMDGSADGFTGGGGAGGSGNDGAPPAPQPPWLLLSFNAETGSELVAYSIDGARVDGRLPFEGSSGQALAESQGPVWLLEETADKVLLLDPSAPWKVKGSWDVHLDDTPQGDAGKAYADPATIASVIVNGAATKSYVLRFNRNKIAVIAPSAGSDSGAATTIDLTTYLGQGDRDGNVDMVAALYVPSKSRLYVVLGNVDLTTIPKNGAFVPCASAKPHVVAIDTTTDAVDPAFGTAGKVDLPGFNPIFSGLLYDGARDRLLIANSGCNALQADGDAGALARREIDTLSLGGLGGQAAADRLVDLTAGGYPSTFTALDPAHAVLGTFSGASVVALDDGGLTPIASPPDLFVPRSPRTLVGVAGAFAPDGSVVEVPVSGGGAVPHGAVPASLPGAFLGAVEIAPKP